MQVMSINESFRKAKLKHQIKVSNVGTASVDEGLCIVPSWYTTATDAGGKLVTDGEFQSTLDAVMTGAGSPGKIKDLHGYIKHSSLRCVGIAVKSNKADQLSQAIQYSNLSPFVPSVEVKQIVPGDVSDENITNTLAASVDLLAQPIIFDGTLKMNTTLEAASTIELNFYFAEEINNSDRLKDLLRSANISA